MKEGACQPALACSNFIDAPGGFIPTPEGYILGGHAITAIGWDDNLTHTYPNGETEKGFIIILNSWGEDWGDKGIGYIPYSLFNWKTDLGMTFVIEMLSVVDLNNTVKHYKVQIGAFKLCKNSLQLGKFVGAFLLMPEPTNIPQLPFFSTFSNNGGSIFTSCF